MVLTDTHTHLYYEDFLKNIDTVIDEAKKMGVSRFFLPNIDINSYSPLLKLAKMYPESCFPMAGIHPVSIKKDYIQQIEKTITLLDTEKFYAIGEIGMDLYHDKSFKNEQKEAFEIQIKLAKKKELPIIIHCREAFNNVLEILERNQVKENGVKGIFHCFSGTLSQAHEVINKTGFALGVGGIVTFKNANLSEIVKSIDIENIVLETDAPYLAPVPYRGKRNASKHIRIIAEKVAEIKKISLEEVAEITTLNSRAIFKI